MHDSTLFYRSIYAALFIGASSMLYSCNDDIRPGDKNDSSDRVCFRLTEASWGNAADTRSTSPVSREIGRAVLRSTESSDTLCLTAIETNGINLGSSTRGSQISSKDDLSSFGCFAYVGTTPGKYTQFYINNDEYTKNGEIYQSDNIQYWPGSALNFKFYCYAPFNASGLSLPESPESTILQYVVPESVTDQKDLMLAPTEEYPGNRNDQVPLTFTHLLSAVRIVTGKNMQAGTVKSVSFKNLYGSANIDMDNPTAWQDYSLYESSYTVSPNVTVTSGQADQVIVGGENTLLMLPQTMKPVDGLEPIILTIVFNDGTKDRTLETELTGEWLMGMTYTYYLSITPEYTLEFNETEPIADAHYVIKPIHIKAGDLNGGSYTVVSSNPDICKLRANLVGPEEQGYWPKESTADGDFVRSNSLTLNAEGDVLVYAFLTENATEADRTVDLQLQYNGSTVNTLTLTQKCPVWTSDGTMGWENTEEDPEKPFGFAWNRKVTYDRNNGWGTVILSILNAFGGLSDNPAVQWTKVKVGRLTFVTGCTIDYSQVQSLSNVYDDNDGLANTKAFRANSASDLSALESNLQAICTATSESGDNIKSVDFAALVCIKKNACDIDKQTGADNSVVYMPSFTDADIKWYLPASGQFTGMPADMNGKVYWSSTAINDNENAYSWNGAAAPTLRMENHNVRAVRVKD